MRAVTRRPAFNQPSASVRRPGLVAIMLVATALAGCVATTRPAGVDTARSALPGLLQPPEGRATLVMYQDTNNDTLTNGLVAMGDALLTTHAGRLHLIDTGGADISVVHALPQTYRLWVGSDPRMFGASQAAEWRPVSWQDAGGQTREELTLRPGGVVILKATGSAMNPTVRRVDRQTALADPVLANRLIYQEPDSRPPGRDAAITKRFLGAREVRFDHRDGCLQGNVTAEWPNAQLTAATEDCRMTNATLTYDDGTRVRMGLGRSLIEGASFRDFLSNGAVRLVADTVIPGTAAERSGLKAGDRIVAINGTPLRETSRGASTLHARLQHALAAAGDTATLRVRQHDNAPERELRVPLAPHDGNRLHLLPTTTVDVSYTDGSRLSGPIALLGPSNSQGRLPAPTPSDVTAQDISGRSGYLGGFVHGRRHGYGYCFDTDGGAPCVYDNGVRIFENGAPDRSRKEVMADLGGLEGRAAVDLLRQRLVDALLEERWSDYLARLADLYTLGVDPGLAAIYHEARALAALGRAETAFDRARTYVEVAGPSGDAYTDALALLSELQPRAKAAREQRRREQAQARSERRALCEARVRADAPLCGCREFEDLNIAEAACDI